MISFILATRNDGYGGEIAGVKNFTMRRLQITVASIQHLPVETEVVVVEWDPPPNRPRVRTFLPDPEVRVIAVESALQRLLSADHDDPPLPFYEYVAKDIGIGFTSSEDLVVCNPDNIFPFPGFEAVLSELRGGMPTLVKGWRVGIHSSHATWSIERLLQIGWGIEPQAVGIYGGAAGDFCAMKRSLYRLLGGFAMVHANWHVDGDFIRRAKSARPRVRVLQFYRHFHINHKNAAVEAEGRRKDFDNVPPISTELIGGFPTFAEEC